MNRLSVHVLLPLVVGGLVALAAVAGVATLVSRDAALHQLDARAGTYRAASEASLVRTGRTRGSSGSSCWRRGPARRARWS